MFDPVQTSIPRLLTEPQSQWRPWRLLHTNGGTTAPIFPLPFQTRWINTVAGKAISAIHSVWTFVLDSRQLLRGRLISHRRPRLPPTLSKMPIDPFYFSNPLTAKKQESFHMTRSGSLQRLIDRLKMRKYFFGGKKRFDSLRLLPSKSFPSQSKKGSCHILSIWNWTFHNRLGCTTTLFFCCFFPRVV